MTLRVQPLVLPILALMFLGSRGTAEDEAAVLKVFVLAGQSHMEGQGVVDLDHPEHYNGGRGTLQRLLQDPDKAETFKHVLDREGRWVVRDDVWCS
jgi:hypothetical protein